MKRKPTLEQQAAAQARRQRCIELTKQIAAMTEEQRGTLMEQYGCVPTCEGHPLSAHNTCLLIAQNPTISLVGGFRQWLGVGRQVRKGERALFIWVPRSSKENDDAAEEPSLPVSEQRHFAMANVFDISQTELCEPEQQ